ncbi:hypothetical protein C1645_834163 [Glomus cerebriforme]|uniref:Uncharacterized protein n=1 Tax=Glomus cerebriforme TaxID=658196 RepID=A0A397SCI4_9GLOM|nr:hypothetical protein C1645_834163 [Glomus cerebriforme]
MDNIDLPSDISQISPKITIGNMLDNNDRKILGNFVHVCNLLVVRFIIEDDLKEAQEKLKDMAYLIECIYGSEFIISNIYLMLHISDYYYNYGSIYSYWLFLLERLNGYITVGSLAFIVEREELQYFLSIKHNTSIFFKLYDTELISDQMLKPLYINIVMSLELYRSLYEWYSIYII